MDSIARARNMIENGFLSVYTLEEGWGGWRDGGYPVEAR